MRKAVGSHMLCRRRCAKLLLLAALVPLAAFTVAGDAPATRIVQVRWTHPGNVAGFRIYTHIYGQRYGLSADLGLPEAVDGIYTYQLEVSNLDATWVQMTAYDSKGAESEPSNERVYLLDE